MEHIRKELTMAPCPLSAQSQQLVKLGDTAVCGYCTGARLTAARGNACCVVSRAWFNCACSWLGWSMLL